MRRHTCIILTCYHLAFITLYVVLWLQVPDLVNQYMAGETLLDKYITHTMDFDQINDAFDLLHSGKTLRTVLTFDKK